MSSQPFESRWKRQMPSTIEAACEREEPFTDSVWCTYATRTFPYDGWRRGLQREAPHCARRTIGGLAALVTGTLRRGAPYLPRRAVVARVRARSRAVALPVVFTSRSLSPRTRWPRRSCTRRAPPV